MYSWERISPETDTTIRMIHEAARRGHTIALATVNNLTIRDSVASAFCDVYIRGKDIPANIPNFHKTAKFKRTQLPLAGFDVIFMRTNPPLDNIALNFLDSVKADTFIMNDIDGLRIANNKMYTTSFHDEAHNYIPATHVSKSRDYLERIFNESKNEKMILKPLNGFGGQGVILIEKSARDSFRSLLDFYIGRQSAEGNYVILQDYIEGAENGDVRILMLNGEPIGAMRRIPTQGDLRSNVHAGGSVQKHTLTAHEKALCKFIGPKLVHDGIYFAGIDVLQGKLLEINVQSPGGITRINMLNKVKLQEQVLDFVEGVVKTRNKALNRKNEFRKVIENADIF